MAAAIRPTPDAAPRVERFYLPELDALRFFAFFAVFCCHLVGVGGLTHHVPSDPWLAKFVENFGAFGVDLFFALSAYLITELLMRERSRRGEIDIRAFLIRRALRIFPLYFAFVGVVAILAAVFISPPIMFAYLAALTVFLGNIAMALKPAPGVVLDPLWSLSVEEQFYWTWPFMCRHADRRKLILFAITIWAVAIVSRGILMTVPWVRAHPVAIWYFTLTRLDPIACGILLAACLNGATQHRFNRARLFLAGALLWSIAALLPGHTNYASPVDVNLAYPLVAIGSGALLLATIGSGFGAQTKLVGLGQISYGLYVFHGAMLTIASTIFWHARPILFWTLYPALALSLTIGIAVASHRWLEAPFLRMKTRFQYVRSAPA